MQRIAVITGTRPGEGTVRQQRQVVVEAALVGIITAMAVTVTATVVMLQAAITARQHLVIITVPIQQAPMAVPLPAVAPLMPQSSDGGVSVFVL